MITTKRVMGIETEYGVLARREYDRMREGASASAQYSGFAVAAYALIAQQRLKGSSDYTRVRWDYGDETPLKDARGFEMKRTAAHPTQLTDEVHDAHVPSVDLEVEIGSREAPPEGADVDTTLHWAASQGVTNAVLDNGARLYVDHAHPEYSAPEVVSAREAVLWDRAGDLVAAQAMKVIDETCSIPSITLYKNNTDGQGSSYGTHENYLVSRSVPFSDLVRFLTPFFVTRQLLVGSGRVGIGTHGRQAGYQLSARADFFEAEVGLETTINRPIINTRDEPHADRERFRRLHVIIGDANMSEVGTFLKLGMTSLVLAAIEANPNSLPEVELESPVEALKQVSRDLSLSAKLKLKNGGTITALEIQRRYFEAVSALADPQDPETQQVLTYWQEILDALPVHPEQVADKVEWIAKKQLLDAYRLRGNLGWDDAKLRMIDIQFSDLRPEKSLGLKLSASGRLARVVSPGDVEYALLHPPTSTRAYLRGNLIRAHASQVESAGWDVINLIGADNYVQRLRFAEPEWGSETWCAAHGLDPAASLEQVLATFRMIAEKGEMK